MAPLIPRIESAEVGSKLLTYLIRPGSDFRVDPDEASHRFFGEGSRGTGGPCVLGVRHGDVRRSLA